jgi:hypothetical protein
LGGNNIMASYGNGGVIGPTVPVSSDTAETITNFVSPGTFSPGGAGTADLLIIGGGGGAHCQHAGGGGAGGILYVPGYTLPGTPVAVAIGAGGAGAGTGDTNAQAGSPSTFGTLTGLGGGRGGAYTDVGGNSGDHWWLWWWRSW